MKIGCAAWILCKDNYAPPYDEPIRLIGKMGFECVEMILNDACDLDHYYTEDTTKSLRSLYESYGMQLSEFAVHTPLLSGLASLDPAKNKAALELFQRAADVAWRLGARAMNLVSNWMEFDCPHGYPPAYFVPFANGSGVGSPKWNMGLPCFSDYSEIWTNYMETLKKCLAIAQSAGMTFHLEAHANAIVSNSDAMLRMFDAIPSEDFGINFDVAWHLMQREYPSLALRKLGRRVKHLHLRDGDGLINYSLPCGMGIVDWVDIFKTLKDIGFEGTCSFEIGAHTNMLSQLSIAKANIKNAIDEAGMNEK